MAKKKKQRRPAANTWLDGQLLIAMPGLYDGVFARSVVYVCAHSKEGAMGLILNQRADDITFPGLLEQLGLVEGDIVADLAPSIVHKPVHLGGPVETSRGFVLHSADYHSEESTTAIDGEISLTATLDVLKAMAEGHGPDQAMLALGYAGWAAGQLESEIQANGWLSCPADLDLVFGGDVSTKYRRAMTKLGIDPAFLVAASGRA